MPKFRQEETLLCPITFLNEVEAENVVEAAKLFNEANAKPNGVRLVSKSIGAPKERSVTIPVMVADDGNRPTTGDLATGETQQTSTGEQAGTAIS